MMNRIAAKLARPQDRVVAMIVAIVLLLALAIGVTV
jgi:hypothetical protein